MATNKKRTKEDSFGDPPQLLEEEALEAGSADAGCGEDSILDLQQICEECKASGIMPECEPDCWVIEAKAEADEEVEIDE